MTLHPLSHLFGLESRMIRVYHKGSFRKCQIRILILSQSFRKIPYSFKVFFGSRDFSVLNPGDICVKILAHVQWRKRRDSAFRISAGLRWRRQSGSWEAI
jgi:hypothetical protein